MMGLRQFAGTIGGVDFEELPGSPRITVNSDGMTAVRMLRILWSDQWAFIEAMTDKRQQTIASSPTTFDYPGFPGSWSNLSYMSKLQVDDIEIKPAFDGNQEGITVDASNNNIGAYDLAEVTITYRLYDKPSRRAVWTTRTNAVRPSRIWKFTSGQANGDPANPTKYLPDQEIMIPIYPFEWDRGIDDNASILNLSKAEEKVGLINSDSVNIGFGRESKRYPKNSLLFASFEVENVFRYAKADHAIVYRFIVAPAYLDNPDDFDNTDLNPWEFAYSAMDNSYIPIENQVDPDTPLFNEADFEPLFPWGSAV